MYYDLTLSLQEQIANKPPKVHEAQWKNLVEHWNKKEVQIISKKKSRKSRKKEDGAGYGKKELRSYSRRKAYKKELGHYPSRMDLFVAFYSKEGASKNEEASKAIEQMQELKSQLPEGSLDEPGPDDVLSKVLGKDTQGRACMYGLGVRTSDVWGEVPSRSASHRENMQWKNAYETLSSELAEVRAELREIRGNANGTNASNGSGSSASVNVASGDHRTIAHQSRHIRDGIGVYLKSITDPTETVAKGWVHSLDPTTEVGGEEIGPNWCEVHIEVPVKRNERLVRPYGLFATVGDAIGATVAWPCNFTAVVPEDEMC